MATTGADFSRILDDKGGRNYSAYFSDAKKNRIVKEATIKYIDLLYATNDRQRIKDELFALYKTVVAITPIGNLVDLIAGISDYDHLIQLKSYFRQPLTATVSGASNASPIKLTISGTHNIRTGEQLLIAGVLGNTGANGYRFTRMINSTQGYLYSDSLMTVPVVGTGTYSSGGTLQRIVGQWMELYSQKTSALDIPDVYNPKYEVANGYLKLYPTDQVCETIHLDYISKPQTFIDVANNVTDLEATYSLRFIYNLADETCRLMGMESRDVVLQQNEQSELVAQP